MSYIQDNNMLLQYIPNVVTAVEGEADLFTKLQSFLQIAEAWLEANVVRYADIADNETAMTYAKIIVADDAHLRLIILKIVSPLFALVLVAELTELFAVVRVSGFLGRQLYGRRGHGWMRHTEPSFIKQLLCFIIDKTARPYKPFLGHYYFVFCNNTSKTRFAISVGSKYTTLWKRN